MRREEKVCLMSYIQKCASPAAIKALAQLIVQFNGRKVIKDEVEAYLANLEAIGGGWEFLVVRSVFHHGEQAIDYVIIDDRIIALQVVEQGLEIVTKIERMPGTSVLKPLSRQPSADSIFLRRSREPLPESRIKDLSWCWGLRDSAYC